MSFTDKDLVDLKKYCQNKSTVVDFFGMSMTLANALIARLEAAERRGDIAAKHVGICPEFELSDISWRKAAGKWPTPA